METVESAVTEQPLEEKETAEQAEQGEEKKSPEEVEMIVVSEQKPVEHDGGQVQSVVEQIAIETETGGTIDGAVAIVEGVTAKEMTEYEVADEAEEREVSGWVDR